MHQIIDKSAYFTETLSQWYQKVKRDLPWRNTTNPYKIWLSEIILQQTRVQQGLNYYLKFIEHYPTVESLANASEQEVLKDWQGLGYYSRARNLHAAAKFIANDLKGEFPNNFESIKQLKGVGDYTAAAIASFAFQLPHAVVDGNVYRFLSRLVGISTPIDSTFGKKEFQLLANQLLNRENPAIHNQAIMEFGAIQCTASSPNCMNCVFNTECVAYKTNAIADFPKKAGKVKQRIRYLNYLILENDSHIALNFRDAKGIWQNMYDFPCVETKKEIQAERLQKEEAFQPFNELALPHQLQSFSQIRKHILSHQILFAKFFHFRVDQLDAIKSLDYKLINKKELRDLPIPKLIENYLNEETNLLSLFN